ALFSLPPLRAQPYKLTTDLGMGMLLLVLNLRGMRESIKVLLPIFLGFFITHAALIVFGISLHADRLPGLVPETVADTSRLAHQLGWVFVASLFLRAYSLGGGTYT